MTPTPPAGTARGAPKCEWKCPFCGIYNAESCAALEASRAETRVWKTKAEIANDGFALYEAVMNKAKEYEADIVGLRADVAWWKGKFEVADHQASSLFAGGLVRDAENRDLAAELAQVRAAFERDSTLRADENTRLRAALDEALRWIDEWTDGMDTVERIRAIAEGK